MSKTFFADGVYISPKLLTDGTFIWQVVGFTEDDVSGIYCDGDYVDVKLEGSTLEELTNGIMLDKNYVICPPPKRTSNTITIPESSFSIITTLLNEHPLFNPQYSGATFSVLPALLREYASFNEQCSKSKAIIVLTDSEEELTNSIDKFSETCAPECKVRVVSIPVLAGKTTPIAALIHGGELADVKSTPHPCTDNCLTCKNVQICPETETRLPDNFIDL